MVLVTAISGLFLAHAGSTDPRAEQPRGVRGSGTLAEALPINDLLIASLNAVKDRRLRVSTEGGALGRARGPAAIDRVRFRPDAGTIQVLLRDLQPLEVILDWKTAQVLSVAPRHEYRWLRLHSAEDVLGEDGTLKRDAIAILIVLMSLTGIGIWFRDRARADLSGPARIHRRLGLVAGLVLLVPAVTGVLMNHRVDLGFTYRPLSELEPEQIVKAQPARLSALVTGITESISKGHPNSAASGVDWLEYFPRNGTITLGFHDGTDVFANVYSGEVRAIKPPGDTWVRQLHTGRLFAGGWLIRDLTALLWIVVTCGGLYRAVRQRRVDQEQQTSQAPAVRHQLIVTLLLFVSAWYFGSAALRLSQVADGWTTRGIWIALLGLTSLAAAVGPWLWAQTVRSHRMLLGAILIGSGGGLLALLPGVHYHLVLAAQAALVVAVLAQARTHSTT